MTVDSHADSELQASSAAIDQCLLRDRISLRRELARIIKLKADGKIRPVQIKGLEKRLLESSQIIAERRAWPVNLSFPEALPICHARKELAEAISENPVVIICGETGSGKTTQLPKICLGMGRGVFGQIGHTQPRRIAARSVARRIADEMNTEIGKLVGYQTRFDKSVSDASRIKLMTDGILLSELRHDRLLRQYDTLIIDEAHERSLNIDFLLGYLRKLVRQRQDLKIIITSATIDTDKFSRHFDKAPVIEVSGRTFPVDIEYASEQAADGGEGLEPIVDAVANILSSQRKRGRGDILVFLPGERHISECRNLLRKRFADELQVLPLFGRLSARDQDKVFGKGGKTRCVLATNIAETSLTVPGIRYVIDTGLARISRYSVRSKVQQLPVEKISQASAQQRAGRCGRLENGLCIRLYSEADFIARPAHTDPEIRRTNLASVILDMTALKLGKVEDFPFVDKPEGKFIRDGYRLLQELQAFDENGKLLGLGGEMARLPVDPRIARILLAARKHGCMPAMLIIGAAMSMPDPRQRPADNRSVADQQHAQFADPSSDFIGLLNLWRAWKTQQAAGSQSQLRRWCKKNFLSYTRMREWQDLVHQLHGLSGDTRSAAAADVDDYASIHRALLSGLLSHVGTRDEEGAYQGVRGRQFRIFPGSGTRKSKAKWIVAAQLVETSHLYAHVVAKVQPAWIEEAASHLVRREYDQPRWHLKRGQVLAHESVSLYGLPLVTGRTVNYGLINPLAARDVFIREALLENKLGIDVPFLVHNQNLLDEVKDLEARARRHDVLVEDDVRFAFYARHIPDSVFDLQSFRRWLRKRKSAASKALFMDREMLMQHDAESISGQRFPDHLTICGNRVDLEYHFERGQSDDGVTAIIPLSLLNQVPDHPFEFLVPGFLTEKIEALIRNLPKTLRRNFVPVPRFAQAALEDAPAGTERSQEWPSLSSWLAGKLQSMTGVEVRAADFISAPLPAHLNMNFKVIDDQSRELGAERSLRSLREQFGEQGLRQAIRTVTGSFGESGIRDWSFGELPESVTSERSGRQLTLFPMLQDAGDSVTLALHDNPETARAISIKGIVRLTRFALQQQFGLIQSALRSQRQQLLGWQRFGNDTDFADQVFEHLIIAELVQGDQELPRTRVEYKAALDRIRPELVSGAEQLIRLVREILALDIEIGMQLRQLSADRYTLAREDIETQREQLLHREFVCATPGQWLARYPIYLQAIRQRMDGLQGNLAQDSINMNQVLPFQQNLVRLGDVAPDWLAHPNVQEFRWLSEELRVSLFAQRLGTVRKVSVIRLQRYWQDKVVAPMARTGHAALD